MSCETAGAASPHWLRYHVAVHPLAQRGLSHIRREELLRAGDRVGVAVSGGIDSVALFRLLLELRGELGIVLSVVHFNHKLRGAESDADERFVANLAREHDLEFLSDSEDIVQYAVEEHVSVEAAARELRYGFFRHLLGEDRDGDPQGLKPDSEELPLRGPKGPLFHSAAESRALSRQDKIVTGHTLDDQAETVLMRMIRGAGLRGLGAIYPRLAVEDDDGELCGEIVRPLLMIRRWELEQYLKELASPGAKIRPMLTLRSRATGCANSFSRCWRRNSIRRLLKVWRIGGDCPGEEDYWENEVAGWMGTAVHWAEPDWAVREPSGRSELVQIAAPNGPGSNSSANEELRARIENAPWLVMDASVDRVWFLGEPTAVQRRVVKAIGEQAGIPLEFKHVEEILRFAEAGAGSGRELALPLGWRLEREPDRLVFITPDLREPAPQLDYEYALTIPGTVIVYEAGAEFEAQRIPGETEAAYTPDRLLDAESLPGPLRVRNWRPGDRFWPAHTKSPKKIKELLQERHVALPERGLWPVVVSGDEIVWVRGFPSPARLRAKPGRDAVCIAEEQLGEKAAM